ncbi:hypothetical protein CVT25_011772 [Psilocybe cyanescens]|uniref:Uncharacterized protein n=1 Tax=Psilocybe cyanescens TaxID=93625 RepID=A0A409VV86_PSICY|nr:hypothetical protein CVT25_011772 [Psilocybe cyanescens]
MAASQALGPSTDRARAPAVVSPSVQGLDPSIVVRHRPAQDDDVRGERERAGEREGRYRHGSVTDAGSPLNTIPTPAAGRGHGADDGDPTSGPAPAPALTTASGSGPVSARHPAAQSLTTKKPAAISTLPLLKPSPANPASCRAQTVHLRDLGGGRRRRAHAAGGYGCAHLRV